jgi:hypothetical protein
LAHSKFLGNRFFLKKKEILFIYVDWGISGFFKILRGSDECGIEDDASSALFK